MAKSRHKKQEDFEDTEYYGRRRNPKVQPPKREPRNWKKFLDQIEEDED